MNPCAPGKKRGLPKGVSGNPAGKPKGTKNRRTIAREAGIAMKLTPLAYMQSILDDSKSTEHQKMWASQNMAPYIHRKMPIAIEGGDKPLKVVNADMLGAMSNAELEGLVGALRALGLTGEAMADAASESHSANIELTEPAVHESTVHLADESK